MTDQSDAVAAAPLPLKLVVYVSRPNPEITLEGVRALMFEVRGFNLMNGVTGLLTYDPRGFVQAIEGTAEAIDDLVARIARDTRHRDMRVLLESAATALQFGTFHDAIRSGDQPASLAVLPAASRARLSSDVVQALTEAYRLLDQ